MAITDKARHCIARAVLPDASSICLIACFEKRRPIPKPVKAAWSFFRKKRVRALQMGFVLVVSFHMPAARLTLT
jgi:hypothetical protein